ncbi:MAG TPA: transcription-repair coupling factor [bacterium]|nr:transcription-repair coupling factor [bacterium]
MSSEFTEFSKKIDSLIKPGRLFKRLFENNELPLKGLTGSLKALTLKGLVESGSKTWVAVLPDEEEAEILSEELTGLMGESAALFPGGDEEADSPVVINPRRSGLQMRAIRGLLEGRCRVVVTGSRGFFHRFPDPRVLKSQCIDLRPGIETPFTRLVERLVTAGYSRESMVERPGEISVRGGILDIFPYTGENPHRIEFMGDRVESMRLFDVQTQRSIGSGKELMLIPAPMTWQQREHTILDYSDRGCVFIEDPERILEYGRKRYPAKDALSPEIMESKLNRIPKAIHHTLGSGDWIDIGGRSCSPLGRTAGEIREKICSMTDTGQSVTVVCASHENVRRVRRFLEVEEEPISGLSILRGPIRKGFRIESGSLTVYSDSEIFGRKTRSHRDTQFKEGIILRELSALRQGDYVVHIDHGVGRYQGLQKIRVQGLDRECLAVEYQEGDKLYVPVEKMERVQKYNSREGHVPALNRLGGTAWEQQKKKTKTAIQTVARELVDLYSTRQIIKGYAFSPDSAWHRDLESVFPHEETVDQTRAMIEVKRDMERTRPMDRLICGDVGFGKTEVAVRAAFKAVADSKQVAVLVPTTILAQQHGYTFRERLSRFPVHIEMLSRFRSRSEQKEVIEGLASGAIDVVIGTHRLLSKDVQFKDLGLLIIDEEQRFGVRHKERLKSLRENVDVLTLSATPIPRTLHLSLMGIRDMSVINTPPKERLPIHTEVMPFNEEVIAEALEREIERGGQVFFVHNRIRSIYGVSRMIRRLVPGARLAVAHGRMDEKELEHVMLEFGDKKYDCLVSTLIIGSGLDMPNVNTLIVHRADQLGLSQLYQLRGRVGRSDRRAYAYLLTPPFHLLTREALKRLRTIEELTELGSGFQIAMRDLEIRGTGNLLGYRQSGHIDALGFDLYTRMVEEAVREIRLENEEVETAPVPVDCSVQVNFTALLPESYILDESQRVNLYRRFAAANETEKIDGLLRELRDRFGPVPPEARMLAEIARLKIQGSRTGIKRIVVDSRRIKLFFHETWVDSFASSELFSRHIRTLLDSSPVPLRFLRGDVFGIQLDVPEDSGEVVDFTKNLLHRWSQLFTF